MAYYDTPTASIKQNVSQPQIRNNFSQANTSFGRNHYSFSDATANNGAHSNIETPVQASDFDTTSNTAAYARTIGNATGLFFSRQVGNQVPTPLTSLQSPSSPIVLSSGSTTNVFDFSGCTHSIFVAYGSNVTTSGTLQIAPGCFDGTNLTVSNLIFSIPSLTFVISGTILQLKANLANLSNVYWTLNFQRIY